MGKKKLKVKFVRRYGIIIQSLDDENIPLPTAERQSVS